jgi:hypothetical protein
LSAWIAVECREAEAASLFLHRSQMLCVRERESEREEERRERKKREKEYDMWVHL